jgi:hypothetical protein
MFKPMQTVQIGNWEFIREPGRLSYRLTAVGVLPGVLLMILLSLVFGIWSFQTFKTASGPLAYLGGSALAAVTLACCYGFLHHLRGRSHPYVLDRSTNSFSNGYRTLCALSDVKSVEVTRTEGVKGSNGPSYNSYYVNFVLKNGDTLSSYMMSTTQNMSEQLAHPLQQFLHDVQN